MCEPMNPAPPVTIARMGTVAQAAWVAASVPSSSRCTSTVWSGVRTSRPRNGPLRSLNSIQSEAPFSMTCRASSIEIWRPLVDFQITNPQPVSFLLFHDEQP